MTNIEKRAYELFPTMDSPKWTVENEPLRKLYITTAKQQLAIDIEKVCSLLKNYRRDTPDGYGYIAGVIDDKTIADIKQKMMEDENEKN